MSPKQTDCVNILDGCTLGVFAKTAEAKRRRACLEYNLAFLIEKGANLCSEQQGILYDLQLHRALHLNPYSYGHHAIDVSHFFLSDFVFFLWRRVAVLQIFMLSDCVGS